MYRYNTVEIDKEAKISGAKLNSIAKDDILCIHYTYMYIDQMQLQFVNIAQGASRKISVSQRANLWA